VLGQLGQLVGMMHDERDSKLIHKFIAEMLKGA
jgi:hypothetical protein